MSEHVLSVTLEGGGFAFSSLKVCCNASADALCRNMPDCDCEAWGEAGRDSEGWFHKIEGQIHRHNTPVTYCNICEWLNADDPIECLAKSVKSFHVADVPIEPIWAGDFYEWKPLEGEQS